MSCCITTNNKHLWLQRSQFQVRSNPNSNQSCTTPSSVEDGRYMEVFLKSWGYTQILHVHRIFRCGLQSIWVNFNISPT